MSLQIHLKQFLSAIGLSLAALSAQADVLSFSDLPQSAAGDSYVPFTSTYHGFDFGNNDFQTNAWFSSDHNAVVDPLLGFNTHSGSVFVATYADTNPSMSDLVATMAISSTTAFGFDGAWFDGTGHIRYELSLGGVVVYTSDDSLITLQVPAALYVASGYSGLVDSVVIYGMQGYYAMSDFTYTPASAAAVNAGVPEPGSLALVLLAGGAVVGASRRRRSVSAA